MKRVSDGSKPAMVIPPVVEPIQVQLALVVPVIEIRYVAVAIAVLPCTGYHPYHCPLNTLRAASNLGFKNPPVFRTKYFHFLRNCVRHSLKP